MLVHEIRKLEQLQEQLGEEANQALEVLQKEVACHRLGNQDAAETIAKLQAEMREMRAFRSLSKEVDLCNEVMSQNAGANLKDEITRLHTHGNSIANLEEKLENVQKSLDKLVMSLPNNNCSSETPTKSSKSQIKKKKQMLPLTMSSNANRPHIIRAPCSPLSSSRQVLDSEVENKVPENDTESHENNSGSEKVTPSKSEDGGDISSRDGTPRYQRSSSVNMKKMQKMFQNAAEENVRSIRAYVIELKERVAKLQYQKQLLVCQIYIEVEVRRLTWLQEHFDEVGNASPAPTGDDPISLSSSTKALRYEREFLAKRLQSRLTEDERERLYIKWQVPLEGKQRKLQLVNKLWRDPNDAAHIEESAAIVARLVGFCEGGNNMAKEMFELNFALPASKKPWLLGWQPISNLLGL
ncbi:hypothetical protein B296_00016097 [Ensete ventricosum]|uniref:NPK1-activating kinesin-like protein C-terminal domain-containing protein n=1 Tax=Ensete ventricosum TaxID=4639 RepID=A0A426YKS6_ENSVE|nr:hypothetical protein B296_00016097 [Ensete ventricosum]